MSPPAVPAGDGVLAATEALASAAGAAVAAGRLAARQQAQTILADAQAALRHILDGRSQRPPSPAPEGVPEMTFPTPLPTPGRPGGKTPMEIAQELAEAAMAASEEGIRAAMAVSQQAMEAANEAARRAELAAEEAVRQAAEANAR
ncbi:hypothetical protein ABH900_000277 [Stenotrophomonas sp. AN71]|uniref:hypothetical protein n=1 Tax=Stenotrophomonas sp. AN71 TaxID=3156253 RepID=UPI003D1F0BF8